MTREETQELIEHYVRACNGSAERAVLMALNDGYDFVRVLSAMGNSGVLVGFNCVARGLVDRGEITDAGRALLAKGSDA